MHGTKIIELTITGAYCREVSDKFEWGEVEIILELERLNIHGWRGPKNGSQRLIARSMDHKLLKCCSSLSLEDFWIKYWERLFSIAQSVFWMDFIKAWSEWKSID